MTAVIFTQLAYADLTDAHDWYEAQQTGLGSRFLQEIDVALEGIKAFPNASSPMPGDMRRVLLGKFPYGLFFRIKSDIIYVTGCLHTSRDPKVWTVKQ